MENSAKATETEMNRKTIKAKCYIAALIVLLCFSCTNNTVYHSFAILSYDGWERDSVVDYSVEIGVPENSYDMDIELVYNNNYPYSNIYLFVTSTDTINRIIFSDTLNIKLADEYGKWYGKGWGATYQQTERYKQSYKFPDKGKYNISIKQGMRDNPILGIEKIGLRVADSVR